MYLLGVLVHKPYVFGGFLFCLFFFFFLLLSNDFPQHLQISPGPQELTQHTHQPSKSLGLTTKERNICLADNFALAIIWNRMDSDSASVVLPSLSVARNVYHTFDEELYQRTVDEILSDETSFDTSFDEYSGYQTMDGSADARSREKDEYAAASWKGSWHTKKSPYFSTASPASSSFASALKPKKSVKKPSAMTKRYITKVETTDDDEAEDRSFLLTKKNPSASALTISDPALAFAYDHEYMKNVVEEDIVFGSVDPDKRDQLLQFIAAHSFMRKHKYPVKRSTRRKFIQDLNREATSSGLDQATLDRLRQHVKKTYLELFGTNAVYREGSEFGDEIDGTSKRKAKFEKCKESPKDKQPNIKEMTKSLAKNMKNVSDLAMPKPDNELSSASKGKGKSKLLEPRNALKRKQGNDQEPRKKSRNLHGKWDSCSMLITTPCRLIMMKYFGCKLTDLFRIAHFNRVDISVAFLLNHLYPVLSTYFLKLELDNG
ncbi:hypothetical protein P175DRAFT_0121883 [Aspergillus ochraceoroseus IBT 24754]|uniref:Uncharacterized protein n=1 Tax=Aspergillus ochraceoroseus IBT 24754 TaxID=1392256 RepID=A0A2T5LL28_9EURO|nr:uncharacterized protein P175DRAFT_0121883 [Aspergillus ochraceoroseus IBT 24754]PTU16975.1 hypothetical protein P175DRAFT_0121883 [Aspergillus ochraceoroseus IBT 24754]